jgi:probable phosphoglycerate mutase
MRLFLIRHGETAWTLTGQHTSRTDLPLTENGRAQAAKLASRLAGQKFALALTSPRQRARVTAELAGITNAEGCEDLREFDYGDYEGRLKEEIFKTAPGWNIFRDGCPGGESVPQVMARAARVVARVKAAPGDAIVFSHGHMGRILAACWLGQPAAFGGQLALDTCTLNILKNEGDRMFIQTWNCAG